jgi:colanic acid/amylovoran biosynthesis glycosyltransferase
MKIAFMVGKFPSLSETFVLNQITGLIDQGHEIDIYASQKGNNAKVHPDVKKYNLLDNAHYINMPSNRIARVVNAVKLTLENLHKSPLKILNSFNFFKYKKKALSLSLFYRLLPFLNNKSKKYDMVHCHFGTNGNIAIDLRDIGAFETKISTVFHGYDISTYIDKNGTDVYNELFKKGDIFLPISERWKSKLIDLGCSEEKIKVHHMGIDTEKFKFRPRKKTDKIKILTVARLVEKKGVQYAVKAVAELVKEFPEIEYKIAGDGILNSEIKNLIKELHVEEHIKMLGWKQQDEIEELLEEADFFLAPSVTSEEGDQEGIPVAIMEAMAKGLIVISTFHSGIPELVQDGKTGLLAPERDVDVLVEKLKYLIDNEDEWEDFSLNARKFVKSNFDINKLNNDLDEIFQSLVQEV